MHRSLICLTASLALTTLSGCATTVAIRSMQPGPVPVGATEHLVLLGGQGRRSAREFVAQELQRQCRDQGYFTVEDHGDDGLEVHISGRQAEIEGGDLVLEPGQAGLRIDVLEWSASRDEQEVKHTAPDGRVTVEHVPVQRGQALLAITLFDSSGHAFLSETEYEGWASLDPATPRDEAIECAAREAVHHFLRDVTPIQITARVRLDDEDENQEPYLDAASNGALAQAAHDLEGYLQQHPNSASAAYNLAVLREAMGDFTGAMQMYDHALSLGGKDYYSSARAGCARRLAAQEALRSNAH